MTALLEHRTWYTIRSAALAHGLGFDTRQTKQQGSERLRCALLGEGRLRRAYRALTSEEHEPLIALHMAGGSLPLYEFTARFGDIRRYRPWREDSPPHPWRHPISRAEKLWHLALIEIVRDHRRDRAVLTDEVRALLPLLPRPEPVAPADPPDVNPRAAFCRDLAALLAALLADEVRWLHGRWLSPRSLDAVNRRALIQETVGASELRMGRTRFLHYAAHAAGLIGPHQTTTRAWTWLAQGGHWNAIWEAITRDLHARHPLWQQYRLPEIGAKAWDALLEALAQFQAGMLYTVESLYTMVRFHLSRRKLDELLTVLTWAGLVAVREATFCITPPEPDEAQAARLTRNEDAFYIDLPPQPALPPFVEVSAWAQVKTSHCLRIDAAAVRRAVEQGRSASQIIASLAGLVGAPLDRLTVEQLRAWAKAAHGLTLRPLLVLTAADADTLGSIRSDWRLRPLLREPLSPHHLIVQTDSADELCRRLARRGHPVTRPFLSAAKPQPEDQEYLYLAARVYQMLGGIAAPDIPLPGAVVQRIPLDPQRREALDQAAAAYAEQARSALTGRLVSLGGVAQDDAAAIRAAVQTAYAQCAALRIVYYSPAQGEETIRTIEPILIYRRNGAEYVEAWCQLDNDTRTFRLDRIVRVLDASESPSLTNPDSVSSEVIQEAVLFEKPREQSENRVAVGAR